MYNAGALQYAPRALCDTVTFGTCCFSRYFERSFPKHRTSKAFVTLLSYRRICNGLPQLHRHRNMTSRKNDKDDDEEEEEEEEYSRSRRRSGRGRSYSPRRRSRSRSPPDRRGRRDRSDSPPEQRRRYRGDRDDDRPYHDRRGPPPPYHHSRDPYPPPRGGPPPHRRYHDYPPPPPHDPYYDDRGGGYHRGGGRDGPPPYFRGDGPPPYPPHERFGDRPGPPPGRRGDGRRRGDEGPPGVSLLIRNISPDITSQDLQQAFGRIGDLRDVYIPRDYHSQQPKGFAFIEYATPERAAEARDEMNRFVIKGREIEVVFAQERRKTPNEMRGRVVNQQNHRVEDGIRQERSSSFERHRKQQSNGKDDDENDHEEELPVKED